MTNDFYDDPVGVFDDLDETLGIVTKKSFFKDPKGLERVIEDDQIAFIKLMIEDRDFLCLSNNCIDQNWFTLPESRDIIRVIRDFYDDGLPLTYNNILKELESHYDTSSVSGEISWKIVCEFFEEMERVDASQYKEYFLAKLDEFCSSGEVPSDWY